MIGKERAKGDMEWRRALRWYYRRASELPPLKTIHDVQERRARKRLFGKLSPLVPPVSDMFDGPQSLEEFKRNGEEALQIYKNICGLQPHERILDVGSGIGRKT